MRVTILVSLGAVLGCSGAGSGVDGSLGANDLAVTATTDRATVRPGEQLQITVDVTNNSSSSRDLRFSSGCQTDFEFLDAQGKVVRASQQMCTQSLTQRTLAAGESFRGVHVWTRGPMDPPQLAPGSYQLRGVLLTVGEAVRSAPVAVSVP
jgi:hypothetical protein